MVFDESHTFEHTIHWNVSHLLLATAIVIAARKLSPAVTSDDETDTPVQAAELVDE